jgi:Flp pilus assembly protein protease CpaA
LVFGACSLWAGKNLIESGILCSFCALLSLIAILDHTNHKIPNKLTLFPIPIVFILSYLSPDIFELSITGTWWVTPLVGSLVAGIIFASCYFIPKTQLGGGDVKLALLIGCLSGFPVCFASLFLGLLIFISRQAMAQYSRKISSMSPLAPSLSVGTMISILLAQQI